MTCHSTSEFVIEAMTQMVLEKLRWLWDMEGTSRLIYVEAPSDTLVQFAVVSQYNNIREYLVTHRLGTPIAYKSELLYSRMEGDWYEFKY